MDWQSGMNGFESFLLLEKGLSKHSIEAYLRDVSKLALFIQNSVSPKSPTALKYEDLEQFVKEL